MEIQPPFMVSYSITKKCNLKCQHCYSESVDQAAPDELSAAEAIYWGLESESLVKLDRITQDEILRHYREDYHHMVDLSSPSYQEHSADVLNLFEKYVGQLCVSFEPEDIICQEKEETLNQKEFIYWFYAKQAVPSLGNPIDSQIDSESLILAPRLESNPFFAALEGHYKGSELWEDIKTFKKTNGVYVSICFKLHRIISQLLRGPFADRTKGNIFQEAVRQLLEAELAPIRVKLHLEGVQTDKSAVLVRLSLRSAHAVSRYYICLSFVSPPEAAGCLA